MSLTRRERVLIALCSLAVLGVGVGQCWLRPRLERLHRDESRLAQVRRQIARALVECQQMYRLEREVGRLQVRADKLALSERRLEADLVTALEETALETDVALTNLRPLLPKDRAGVREHVVQLELAAPFPKLVEFLYQLEEAPANLSLRSVQLNARSATSDDTTAVVQVAAYGLLPRRPPPQRRAGGHG